MIWIGTSGWNYGSWRGKFYPQNLKSADWLKFYSKRFSTVEVNYSFYRLPKISIYKKWQSEVSKDFIFAIKASRFITHIKRLKNVKTAWRQFIKNASALGDNLGPILFQFPPNFKATPENIRRLQAFLNYSHYLAKNSRYSRLLFACEPRHKSWFNEEIYKLLREYNTALVIADSSRYPKAEKITADFVYIRMHGPRALFSSKYTDKELKELAGKIKKWKRQVKNIYVYFNNDFNAYAVENAVSLRSIVKSSRI